MRVLVIALLGVAAGYYFLLSSDQEESLDELFRTFEKFMPEEALASVEIISNARQDSSSKPAFSFQWPPLLDEPFPDMEVIDHKGRSHHLSEFFGKVLLIEPVGMTCEACNAFSGAPKKGGFKGQAYQQNVSTIEELFSSYAGGVSLSDERIVFIQVLLYDLGMNAPQSSDAKLWAEHFELDKRANTYVVVPKVDMRNAASYKMIPGFYLVDKKGVLRRDSTGHVNRHSLIQETLPMVPVLINE